MNTQKNLGLVKAIHVGIAPPSNKKILWFDDNVGQKVHKAWNEQLSIWKTISGDVDLSGKYDKTGGPISGKVEIEVADAAGREEILKMGVKDVEGEVSFDNATSQEGFFIPIQTNVSKVSTFVGDDDINGNIYAFGQLGITDVDSDTEDIDVPTWLQILGKGVKSSYEALVNRPLWGMRNGGTNYIFRVWANGNWNFGSSKTRPTEKLTVEGNAAVEGIVFRKNAVARATMYYDAEYITNTLELPDGTKLQLGQEEHYFLYNDSADEIPVGKYLYFTGANSDGVNRIVQSCALAKADNISTARAKCCSTTIIPAYGYGKGTKRGDVNELNTSAKGNQGDIIYLSYTDAGDFTNVLPTLPNLAVEVGRLLKIDATNGSIYCETCELNLGHNNTVNSAKEFYLINTDSTTNASYKQVNKDNTVGETISTIVTNNNEILGTQHINDTPLGITSIPSGQWLANFTAKVSATTGTTRLKIEYHLYHIGGTTTKLFEIYSNSLENTVDEIIQLSYSTEPIACLETDKIMIRVYGTTTSASNKTITYYLGDGKGCFVTIPLPISHVDLSNQNGNPEFQHLNSTMKTFTDSFKTAFDSADNDKYFKKVGGQIVFEDAGGEFNYPIVYAHLNGAEVSSGSGVESDPYLSVSYAIAQTVVSTTTTGDITNLSNVILNVASTANCVIGMQITGTGIPYGTNILSFTSNSITITNNCVGSGNGVNLVLWTPKILRITGSGIVTSQIEKQGIIPHIVSGSNIICNSAITLISNATARVIQQKITIDGRIINYNAGSSFIVHGATSVHDLIIDGIGEYIGYGTGSQVNMSSYYCGTYQNTLRSFKCLFGTLGTVSCSSGFWNGYKYGLLTGIYINGYLEVDGKTECPASVNAIRLGNNGSITCNGIVYGSVHTSDTSAYPVVFNAAIIGSTLNCGYNIYNAHLFKYLYRQTVNSSGFVIIDFADIITLSHSGYSCTVNKMGGAINCSGGDVTINGKNRTDFPIIINTSNAGIVNINNDCECGGSGFTCGVGSTININGNYKGEISSIAGTVNVNRDAIFTDDKKGGTNYRLTGTLNIYGRYILTRSYGSEVNDSVTPEIKIGTGTVKVHGGRVECALADSKSGLFCKYGSGGKLILKNCELRVANGKSPLRIASDVGTTEDIVAVDVETNLDPTSGLEVAFQDTTYGTTYTPNFLRKIQLAEDTTYTW